MPEHKDPSITLTNKDIEALDALEPVVTPAPAFILEEALAALDFTDPLGHAEPEPARRSRPWRDIKRKSKSENRHVAPADEPTLGELNAAQRRIRGTR